MRTKKPKPSAFKQVKIQLKLRKATKALRKFVDAFEALAKEAFGK